MPQKPSETSKIKATFDLSDSEDEIDDLKIQNDTKTRCKVAILCSGMLLYGTANLNCVPIMLRNKLSNSTQLACDSAHAKCVTQILQIATKRDVLFLTARPRHREGSSPITAIEMD